MCFTSGPTSDERGSSLTDGLRAKLLHRSGSKRDKSKLSKSYNGVKSQPVAKVVARAQKSPSRSTFNRIGSPADIRVMQKTEAMTNSLSPKGVRSERVVSNSDIAPKGVHSERFVSNSTIVPKDVHSERFTSDSENRPNLDKKAFISAQFVSKMNAKQMKGMMKGVGKELRRAASTVGERLPNPTKKRSKEERERLELLEAELQKPQARNPDEIKKAYGHVSAVDTKQAAMITRDKLCERGEKISAIQRRTTELEADAANFSSLAHELVKKMESKKWYEFN